MTKVIGLTGGIGSGKTTIANYFQAIGIPVYIADDEARTITESPKIIIQIKNAFGDSVIENGQVNRSELAAIVFNDAKKLQILNNIIHPEVKNHFLSWKTQHPNAAFIIRESAILFETKTDSDCDYIITVTAPLETRISRILKRDKTTRESILNRMENQWSDEQRIAKSDFVIQNTSFDAAKHQANEILKKISILQNND